MATTLKKIIVKDKSLSEVMERSREILKSLGFRIKEMGNNLICTRGFGLITAQQQNILRFSEKENKSILIEGEFYVLAFWFLKSTVDANAIAAAIPRRKGYQLMQQFISGINGEPA